MVRDHHGVHQHTDVRQAPVLDFEDEDQHVLAPPVADPVVRWLQNQAELRTCHFGADLREGLAFGTAAIDAVFVLQVDRPCDFLIAPEADDLADGELLATLVEERFPWARPLLRERVVRAVELELEQIPR
jgi:hypothetical protein